MKWLADQGFELCDHTLWHAKLSKYPDAVVQEQIARNAMGIDSAVPGYKIRTMALPYGLWPKNRQLAWQGSVDRSRRPKQTHTYKFDAVLEVAGGPTRSPYDPQFNPHSINRIEAIGNDIRRRSTSSTRTRRGSWRSRRRQARRARGHRDDDIEGDDHDVVVPLVHPCSESRWRCDHRLAPSLNSTIGRLP